MKENKNDKSMKVLYSILFLLIIIAAAMGIYLFRDKLFKGSKTYNLYRDYLAKYDNNEIFNENKDKVKVDTIYVRLIEVKGVSNPVMMVDGTTADDERYLNMYYVDKDGSVKVEYFDNDTYYNAVYNYENKDYKYYLLKRTNADIGYFDHIINLANYINDDTNKEEYDLVWCDPTYIGFELDDKIEVNKNSKDALKKAIKNMKSLDEFYKNEKETIDDAHSEYKAYHEDDEE